MPSDKSDIGSRFRTAFNLRDEIAREEAILELLELATSGNLDLNLGIDDLIAGLQQEESSSVLSSVWHRLAALGPIDRLHACANSELVSPQESHRRWALVYLAATYPEGRRELYEKMVDDHDPYVLTELGEAILPLDRRTAVEVWLRAMYTAPIGLADETLPPLIAQYADDEAIAELEQHISDNPDDQLTGLVLWQAYK
jgi:hypothetical protein